MSVPSSFICTFWCQTIMWINVRLLSYRHLYQWRPLSDWELFIHEKVLKISWATSDVLPVGSSIGNTMLWHFIMTEKYSPKYINFEHYKFKNIVTFLMGQWVKTNVWHRRRISPRAIVAGCLWQSKYKGIRDMAGCPCAAFSLHIC